MQTVVVSGGCFTFDHSFTVREDEKEEIHWFSNKNNFFFCTNKPASDLSLERKYKI